MKIRKGNVFSEVSEYTPAEWKRFREVMTFKVKNFWFMARYRPGWDGTFSFVNAFTKTFPTGLIDVLPPDLKEGLVIEDVRERPYGLFVPVTKIDPTLIGVELRDYQVEAVEKVLEKERAILTSPTNAGKTEMGAAILKALPYPAIWLTHRMDLFFQTVDRLEHRLGERIGQVVKDNFFPCRVTCCMVQSLVARLKDPERAAEAQQLLSAAEIFIADECHHQSAGTWKTVAKKCFAFYRFGLSATPLLHGDIENMWLIGLTGSEVKTVSNQDLIESGISAKPKIKIILNSVERYASPNNYHETYSWAIERNRERNKIAAALAAKHAGENEPVLILVNTIAHGKKIAAEMSVPHVFLTGKEDSEVRRRELEAFKCGSRKIVIATPIFDEGIDAPAVRVLILAAGGKSQIKLLQRLGRGMRKKEEGENSVCVYDFADMGDKYLRKHGQERERVYKEEKFEIEFLTWEEVQRKCGNPIYSGPEL